MAHRAASSSSCWADSEASSLASARRAPAEQSEDLSEPCQPGQHEAEAGARAQQSLDSQSVRWGLLKGSTLGLILKLCSASLYAGLSRLLTGSCFRPRKGGTHHQYQPGTCLIMAFCYAAPLKDVRIISISHGTCSWPHLAGPCSWPKLAGPTLLITQGLRRGAHHQHPGTCSKGCASLASARHLLMPKVGRPLLRKASAGVRIISISQALAHAQSWPALATQGLCKGSHHQHQPGTCSCPKLAGPCYARPLQGFASSASARHLLMPKVGRPLLRKASARVRIISISQALAHAQSWPVSPRYARPLQGFASSASARHLLMPKVGRPLLHKASARVRIISISQALAHAQSWPALATQGLCKGSHHQHQPGTCSCPKLAGLTPLRKASARVRIISISQALAHAQSWPALARQGLCKGSHHQHQPGTCSCPKLAGPCYARPLQGFASSASARHLLMPKVGRPLLRKASARVRIISISQALAHAQSWPALATQGLCKGSHHQHQPGTCSCPKLAGPCYARPLQGFASSASARHLLMPKVGRPLLRKASARVRIISISQALAHAQSWPALATQGLCKGSHHQHQPGTCSCPKLAGPCYARPLQGFASSASARHLLMPKVGRPLLGKASARVRIISIGTCSCPKLAGPCYARPLQGFASSASARHLLMPKVGRPLLRKASARVRIISISQALAHAQSWPVSPRYARPLKGVRIISNSHALAHGLSWPVLAACILNAS